MAQHPLREGLCGQLMLALYGSGRQSEALEVFRELRDRLDRELGLVPGGSLHELQRAILNGEPALPRATPELPRAGRGETPPRAVLGFSAACALGPTGRPSRRGCRRSARRHLAGLRPQLWQRQRGDRELGTGRRSLRPHRHRARRWRRARTRSLERRVPLDEQRARRHRLAGRQCEPDGRLDPGRAKPRGSRVRQWAALGRQRRRRRHGLRDRSERKQGGAYPSVSNSQLGLAARDSRIWVANSVDGTLSTIDTRSGSVVRTIRSGRCLRRSRLRTRRCGWRSRDRARWPS